MNVFASVAFLIASLPSGFAMTPQAPPPTHRTPPTKAILAWLPENSTSIIVSNEAGQFDNDKDPGMQANLAKLVPLLPTMGLPAEGFKVTFKFAVNGNLLTTTGYKGCVVAGVSPRENMRLESFIKQKSLRHGPVGGLTAYVFEREQEGMKVTFFIALSDGLLFCATDKAYLATVLNRRAHPSAVSAFPETLEQWRYIDKSAPFWVVRRITPEWKHEVGGDLRDDKLFGYSISLDSRKQRLTVISFSKNQEGYGKAVSLWKGYLAMEKAPAPIEIVKIDDQTTRIVLDAQAPKGAVALFLLFVVIGHPIAV